MSNEHSATLQTNLDTLLFCSNLLCRKLPQVSEYGPLNFGWQHSYSGSNQNWRYAFLIDKALLRRKWQKNGLTSGVQTGRWLFPMVTKLVVKTEVGFSPTPGYKICLKTASVTRSVGICKIKPKQPMYGCSRTENVNVHWLIKKWQSLF
jgi:hypothetical protein